MSRARSHLLSVARTVFVGALLCARLAWANDATAGIGAVLTMQDGWVTVVEVYEDMPASRAGLKSGFRIARVDGQSVRDVEIQDAIRRIIGPPGTTVTLTVLAEPGDTTEQRDVTLTRAALASRTPSRSSGEQSPVSYERTRDVQWRGNRIISRVLPYPDFVSLFIRLPIAHAAATGQGAKVAVVQRAKDSTVTSLIEQVAPDAKISTHSPDARQHDISSLCAQVIETSSRVIVVPDPEAWPNDVLTKLAETLIAADRIVVVPSDLSEEMDAIATINALHAMGVLTVGRLNRQSIVMKGGRSEAKPFNPHIRKIETDVFSTVGLEPRTDPRTPTASVAGVAALVLEKWPDLTASEVRQRIVDGARRGWQATSIETGQWRPSSTVDPITTQYVPTDEEAIFRFGVLDAAGALNVDTEIPWFLNMMNCHKAWELTRGQGVTVVVTDQGFHIKHPELVGHIKTTKHFGRRTFDSPGQNFHGTDMSRILLSVAPQAEIIPVLCSARTMADLPPQIAKSFEFAAEQQADVITASWSGRFQKDEALLAAIQKATAGGVTVSWFHYPRPDPNILRSSFTYAWWEREPRLGFADRFLTDPPGFRPVEIGAGLSGTAPQAAGLAALVKSVNPQLSPAEIKQIMFENSDPVGGAVLIPDAYRIVKAAQEKATH